MVGLGDYAAGRTSPAICNPNPNFGKAGGTIGSLAGTGTSRQTQVALKPTF